MEFTGFEVFDEFNDQTMAEDIKNKLKEKYGKEFEVLRIGNRFGGTSTDRIDTYCAPIDNQNIVFTAVQDMTVEGEETEFDDYYLKCVTNSIDEFIIQELSQYGIEVLCKTEIVKKNSLEENLLTEDFIIKYPNAKFISIIVAEEIEKFRLQEAFEILKEKFPNIKLNSIIYTTNKENICSIKETLYGIPYIPKTLVEKQGFEFKTYMKIENETVSEVIGE